MVPRADGQRGGDRPLSHRLDEAIEIGDFVTVLRDGQVVAESPIDMVDVPWIVGKMVGKDLASLFQQGDRDDR